MRYLRFTLPDESVRDYRLPDHVADPMEWAKRYLGWYDILADTTLIEPPNDEHGSVNKWYLDEWWYPNCDIEVVEHD